MASTTTGLHEQFFCKICYLLFPSSLALQEHKAKERARSDATSHFHCHPCGKDFDTPDAERLHLIEAHAPSVAMQCPGCGKTGIERMSGLMSHIENSECAYINTDMVDRQRGQKLEFAQRLEQLTKTPVMNNFARYMPFHEPVPDVLWDEGLKDLIEVADAEARGGDKAWYEIHDPERPGFDARRYWNSYCQEYLCPMSCPKSFKQPGKLTAHMRTAHGRRVFTCPGCRRQFRSLGAIATHLESESGRCQVRHSEGFVAYVDQLTAGLVEVTNERYEDGSVVYRVARTAREVYGGRVVTLGDVAAGFGKPVLEFW